MATKIPCIPGISCTIYHRIHRNLQSRQSVTTAAKTNSNHFISHVRTMERSLSSIFKNDAACAECKNPIVDKTKYDDTPLTISSDDVGVLLQIQYLNDNYDRFKDARDNPNPVYEDKQLLILRNQWYCALSHNWKFFCVNKYIHPTWLLYRKVTISNGNTMQFVRNVVGLYAEINTMLFRKQKGGNTYLSMVPTTYTPINYILNIYNVLKHMEKWNENRLGFGERDGRRISIVTQAFKFLDYVLESLDINRTKFHVQMGVRDVRDSMVAGSASFKVCLYRWCHNKYDFRKNRAQDHFFDVQYDDIIAVINLITASKVMVEAKTVMSNVLHDIKML